MELKMKLLAKYEGYITSKRPEMQTLHHSTKHGCFTDIKPPSDSTFHAAAVLWTAVEGTFCKR